jgi:protein-S-isoprenylcysteine O-methyltransferase Ste14
MIVTVIFWAIALCLIAILQFEKHPVFHHSMALKYIGLILLITGLILASWGFSLLGLKRSLCLNFFEENVPVVKESLYKYIKNPEDYGLWMALIGLAVFTGSLYNLAIAVEFIIIMIPHIMLESIPLKK